MLSDRMMYSALLLSLALIANGSVLAGSEAELSDGEATDSRVSASDHEVPDRNPSAGAKGFIVALDIGHTLHAGGAKSASGVMEYTFNKRIVELILVDLQKQRGISPFIVDPSGRSISLIRRADIANEHRADLFLSVHHDSVNDRYLIPTQIGGKTQYYTNRFRGYSVFFSQKNPQPTLSFYFAKALGTAMEKQGLTVTRHHAEKIPGESRNLVVPEIGLYRFDDLVVLKGARMPAALLECGVIVNPQEEDELNGAERQAKTVRAVREAVLAMVVDQHRSKDNRSGTKL